MFLWRCNGCLVCGVEQFYDTQYITVNQYCGCAVVCSVGFDKFSVFMDI
jgi:hypothetical protein